ncbi:MAG: nitroreductase [Dehalococcoidia bacterium]|nr:nitroreductase [Dehalococcoidia bacterium]
MINNDVSHPADNPVLTAIRNRRTVREFLDTPVPRNVLERVIEAATWAPNHRITDPWRFIVLQRGDKTRVEVAQLIHDWTLENIPNPNQATRKKSAESAQREILDSPSFIYVYSVPGANEEVTRENYAAVCCAVMNLSLAAYAEGLGVGWSTGKATKPGDLAELIGADLSWDIVGALFIGYPANVPDRQPKGLDHCASWL